MYIIYICILRGCQFNYYKIVLCKKMYFFHACLVFIDLKYFEIIEETEINYIEQHSSLTSNRNFRSIVFVSLLLFYV